MPPIKIDPYEELARFLTGPKVVEHGVSLGMGGSVARDAEEFFALRDAWGVKGYMSRTEAREAIVATVVRSAP